MTATYAIATPWSACLHPFEQAPEPELEKGRIEIENCGQSPAEMVEDCLTVLALRHDLSRAKLYLVIRTKTEKLLAA